MRRVLLALCLVLGLAQSAVATPIIDVDVSEQKGGGYWSLFGVTQSFTVGTTGTLTQVDIKLYSEQDLDALTLSLSDFNPADGSSTLLESSTLTDLDTETQPPGTWFSFPFSTPVTAGDTLAIHIPSSVLQDFIDQVNVYWISDVNVYSGGSVWTSALIGATLQRIEHSDIDMAFRVYVEPSEATTDTTSTGGTQVPEPMSLIMLGTGLIGFATRMRRGNQRRPVVFKQRPRFWTSCDSAGEPAGPNHS